MKFDDMLQQIHLNASAGPIAAEENEYITITANRTFTLPEGFNTTVAYEGDVNSQIITFACPIIYEGHNLFDCQEKRLRWSNSTSSNEGSSKLVAEKLDETTMLLRWEMPPEALSKSGQLTISISIFDLYNGKVAYSWNTAAFDRLKVGATLDHVGYKIEQEGEEYIPSKSEILLVNTESRQIVAPTNYNSTFCNYGDVGTAIVFFQIKRYIRGIDLLNEGTIFNIYWKLNSLANMESSLDQESRQSRALYAVELDNRDSEGMVNIVWRPSRALTENSLMFSGAVTIQLEIISGDGRVWRTDAFRQLKIGASEFSPMVNPLPEEDGNINGYIIDGAVTLSDKKVNTVAGVVKLRQCTANSPILIHKNELVIENDEYGNYVGVKIGASELHDSRTAPYVALAPEVTIIVDGGSATEE